MDAPFEVLEQREEKERNCLPFMTDRQDMKSSYLAKSHFSKLEIE